MTAPPSADPVDRPADPDPPTTRVYVPADERGHRQLDAAVTFPPAGSLEGWTAVDVDAEVWETFAEAKAVYERTARDARLAAEKFEAAVDRLGEDVDRG